MTTRKLVVVGGGIAGLAGARRAASAAVEAGLDLEILLLEASDRLGGKIRSERIGNATLEWGPDSFLVAKPRGVGLARELGLGDDLISPGPLGLSAYLYLRGRLRRMPPGMVMGVPTGIKPLFVAVRDGIINPLGAARAAIEPLLPRRGGGDPTAAEVARYRLGDQVASRMVAPLVAGVFGVPYDEVSMRSALPMLADSRSWVLTMAKRPAASGAPIFNSIAGGMDRYAEQVAAGLPKRSVRIGTSVTGLRRNDSDGWTLATSTGKRTAHLDADAVLIATPTHATSPMLAEVAPETSASLAPIRYHASAVVLLRYDTDALGRKLDASGFLVAPEEGRTVAASSWLNAKWPQQDYDGLWIRAIVTDEHALETPDDALRSRVAAEINEVLEARRSPTDVRMVRWPDALPVYSPGHADRVRVALETLPEGLALAGAAYRGFGIPDCISTGEVAAERLVSDLTNAG